MAGTTYQWGRIDRGWLKALPLVAFLVSAAFTGIAVHTAYQSVEKDRLAAFERNGSALVSEVEDIISDQRYLMLGVRSLFDGSADVSRLDFKRYLDSIDVTNSFPGVYAMGWYLRVPHHMLDEFKTIVRQDRSINPDGYPDFNVFPETDVAEHHVITYRYPEFKASPMFGFDIGSDSERLLTLEHARDSGTFAATAPLKMLDGDASDPGFLLMLPVYSITNPQNLQQRRQSYTGMLSGVFKIRILMAGSSQAEFTSVAIRDITQAKLQDAASSAKESAAEPFYYSGKATDSSTTVHKSIRIGGRDWEFEITLSPDALSALEDSTQCWIIGLLGALFSVLAGLTVAHLTAARDRALKQVESLTADLVRANSELQRSKGDLSQFAYIASHDLQTPVRNVDMSVTLLEDALTNRMDPQVREYLNYLRESAGRMRKLVEDLLEFARVDRETLQLVDLDLNDTANNVLRSQALLIEESGATISIGELPEIRGDQDQMERLFVNLITNGVKYRHADRSPKISVDACLVGSDWEVRFSDNGIGIDKRFFDKVFEPFQRLHSHDHIAGTGLGLGICKQIVGCHDGDIYIETSSDTGTTFVIRLPACEEIFQHAA